MSRIDEMIQELCPEGVAFVHLADVAITVPGLTGKTKTDFSDGNARFASYRNIFANPSLDLESPDFVKVGPGERQNSLRKGDILITGSSESLDEVGMSSVVATEPGEPIYLNSFCFILRMNDPQQLLPGFSKHLFRSESIRKQIRGTASGVTRINISKPRFMKIRIPVPPLEIQREIVRVLDQFTQLEAELEAELEARRRQYEHYRDELMELCAPRHEWLPLGAVGLFERGSALQKKDLVDSGVPCFHYGQVYTHYGISATRTKSFVDPQFARGKRVLNPGDVFIATTSENIEDVGKAVAWLGDAPAVASSDAYIFRPRMDARFVAHFLASESFHAQKSRFITGTKVKRLSGESLARIESPVPPIEKQREIADLLDKFDALVNDLSVGLPAELGARRKQYEYYRDKLLTFKELAA